MNQNIIEKFTDLLGKEKVKVNEPMNRHWWSGRLFFIAFFTGGIAGDY